MNDGVDSLERAGNSRLVADIGLDDLSVDPVQIRAAPAGEVVEGTNLDVPGQELGDEIRPDESASAGDEGSSGNLYEETG